MIDASSHQDTRTIARFFGADDMVSFYEPVHDVGGDAPCASFHGFPVQGEFRGYYIVLFLSPSRKQ